MKYTTQSKYHTKQYMNLQIQKKKKPDELK